MIKTILFLLASILLGVFLDETVLVLGFAISIGLLIAAILMPIVAFVVIFMWSSIFERLYNKIKSPTFKSVFAFVFMPPSKTRRAKNKQKSYNYSNI